MVASGVCHSDLSVQNGTIPLPTPIILGHEVSGQVIQVGNDVTNVAVGDRVAIEPGTPCRNCRECMAGRYHLCPDLVFLATPPYDGALMEKMAIDARNLYRLLEHGAPITT